jgi:FkbM family methyltransferase
MSATRGMRSAPTGAWRRNNAVNRTEPPVRTPIHVACATDEAFAPHCATMLRSLLAHASPPAVRIHVLHGARTLGATTRDRLERMVAEAGAALDWLEVPDALIADFPRQRFHVACWYRILLPTLLPRVERVLYLDSDTLVLQDLAPLWATDLQGRLFGAVVNPLYAFMPDRSAELGLAAPAEYLNSGVLLMDLARMRADGTAERVRRYAMEHPQNVWPEQDALSVVCRGAWLPLHPRWNAQSTVFDLRPGRLPFAPDEALAARRDPAVVHFIGPHKPWHYLCRHPLRRRYADFRRQTPWPQLDLEGRTWRNRLLRPLSLRAQVGLRDAWRRLVGRWRRARLRGPRVMAAFARRYRDAVFVQLGSNDGAKHDPLRAAFLKTRWTGVMVEPVPYVFARLRANYGSCARVRLENVAVAAQSGSLPFYYVAQAGAGAALPDWYDELGSFRRDVVLRHAGLIPGLEARIVTAQVPCLTLAELCRRNHVARIDLLHMDLEGYDYELIKSIDFAQARPVLLIYEHKHLDEADRARCREHLRRAGYLAFEEHADTWCVDTRARDARHRAFLRAWRRIAGTAAG